MKFKVTQFWKDLDKDKYTWDEKTRTFSSTEDNLVLDFNNIYWIVFKTGSYCNFDTGSDCTFKTGYSCTFETGSYCTFDTYYDCTFKTGSDCTFDTSSDCTFKTGSNCVVIRRDIYEIIELEEWKEIKLNWYEEKWFTYLEEKKKREINVTDKQWEEIQNILQVK